VDLTVRTGSVTLSPPSPVLLDLIRHGVLDADLAGLAGLLLERRLPLVVAGEGDPGPRRELRDALLGSVPAALRRIELAGPTEDFAWLPEAAALGWRSDGPTPGRPTLAPADPETTIIVAGDLAAPGLPRAAWAGVARTAVRAAARGYGLAATIDAPSLDLVLDRLRGIRLTDDELSHLGLVLVVREVGAGRQRVAAAHWVRPVARDVHGHVQRLGPAVLAAWDERGGRFEHYAWGVMPELAMRVGRKAGDLEIEADRRRDEILALLRSTPHHH
jgi:hypothetical protein